MAKKQPLKKVQGERAKQSKLLQTILNSGRFVIRYAAINPDEPKQSVFGTREEVEERITQWAQRGEWDREKIEDIEVSKVAVVAKEVPVHVDLEPTVTID